MAQRTLADLGIGATPAPRGLTLADLWRAISAQDEAGQQSPMDDPNTAIQPTGRYMGQQWMPFNLDNMAVEYGTGAHDANRFHPDDIMNLGFRLRREDI